MKIYKRLSYKHHISRIKFGLFDIIGNITTIRKKIANFKNNATKNI